MPPPYCYDYPRPAVTADVVAFARTDAGFRVLLIRRKHDPFRGAWALPGGFVDIDEPIEAAARRELKEETGLEDAGPLEFLGVWGEPGRDPRGRVISMAYAAALPQPPTTIEGGDDADEAAWLDPAEVRGLAFDHDEILQAGRRRLVEALTTGPRGLDFLPPRFDAGDVRRLFSQVGVGPKAQKGAVERFLDMWAAPIPGAEGTYRARPSARAVRGPGRPRRGSRSPSNEG